MWFYLIGLFADSGRQAKALRKADTPQKYERQVGEIFRDPAAAGGQSGLWRDTPRWPPSSRRMGCIWGKKGVLFEGKRQIP